MLLSFTLSMPQNNSWNGRWSGDEKLYVKVCSVRKRSTAEKLSGESFYYNFGDGWCARVDVATVDSKTAGKLRRKSAGFCGYDWMVYSLLSYGEILNTEQQKKKAVA